MLAIAAGQCQLKADVDSDLEPEIIENGEICEEPESYQTTW